MNCKKCGAQIGMNDKFCINCGTPVEQNNMADTMPTQTVSPGSQAFEPGQPTTVNPVSQAFESVQPTVNPVSQAFEQAQSTTNTQSNSYAAPAQQPKKSHALLIVFIMILLVAASVAGTIFVMGKIKNTDETKKDDRTVVTESVNRVHLGNYSFEISDDLEYELEDSKLYICDYDVTWNVIFEVVSQSYSYITANPATVQSNLQQAFYKEYGTSAVVSAAKVKKYGNTEYYAYEVTNDEGLGFVYAYTKLPDNLILGITIVTEDGDLDYSLLERVTPTVASAKKGSANKAFNPFK